MVLIYKWNIWLNLLTDDPFNSLLFGVSATLTQAFDALSTLYNNVCFVKLINAINDINFLWDCLWCIYSHYDQPEIIFFLSPALLKTQKLLVVLNIVNTVLNLRLRHIYLFFWESVSLHSLQSPMYHSTWHHCQNK